MCRWLRSGRRSRPLPCNMSRSASSSPTGFAPPAPRRFDRVGHRRRDALYRRPSLPKSQSHSGFAKKKLRRLKMAVDGNWNLTMSTPMGERNATLSLKNSVGTLTGTQGAEGNSTEIFEGTANGDDVAWKVSITNPMPLTLEFSGKVSGDSISGQMGIGPMGSFPFTGKRAYGRLLEAKAPHHTQSSYSRVTRVSIFFEQ